MIGFLNINSLRNKITDLRLVMERCLPDILVIEETKLNSDFKTESFLINNYQKPIRRDRNEFGGGLMQFVRKGVVCNRVSALESHAIEVICSDLMVSKKRWVIFSIYRPPDVSNLDLFFRELSSSLNSALDKYDNVIVMGDINIDTHDVQHPGYTKLNSFIDVFGLSNLVKDKTCFTKGHSSSIDVLLTNKPRCFQNTTVFETGLSDFHGLVSTLMRTHIPRLKPKVIKYRSYKKFDPVRFLQDVKNTDFKVDPNDADLTYRNLSSNFRKLVDKHAPLKTKVQRGNTAPFMNQQLQKAIYTRSRLKKRLNKNPTAENRSNFKKQRNKCVSIRRKAMKNHFKKATKNGTMSNKEFWDLVKPFLSNKGGLASSDISLVKNDTVITDDQELTEIFNEHYVNIVEKSSGKKPNSIAKDVGISDDRQIVRLILEKYKDHPSVLAIIQNPDQALGTFTFQEIENKEVAQLLKSLDGRKSTGEDKIPPKLVSLAANELTNILTTAVNCSIRHSRFPNDAKKAAVCPLDKGEQNRTVERNFRPVSVLNTFSKIYEKVLKQQLVQHLDNTLSVYVSAYRRAYGTQHVLIRLIEEWRSHLDNDFLVGAILMDLSKAFDCIPHDLLIAKLHAYGFDEDALVLTYSYLKRRKQCVRINNTYSSFQEVISGVPQGSVLGPILFNFYINDLFLFIKQATLYNYADDNTLAYSSKSMPDLVDILERETEVALSWLKQNEMIANPEKFHAILLRKNQTNTSGEEININGKIIKSEETVKLLGVTLDYKLDFDPHISNICKKAATQLNVLKRLKSFIGFKEKKILVQSFIYSNFDYCPLVWYFSSSKSLQKIEKLQERALRFLHNDHTSSYKDLLLKSDRCTMLTSRQRTLCIEIFKTVKQLNPPFMQNIFKLRTSCYSLRNPNDLAHVRPNQTTFGSNSLMSIGPQIWNGLPNELKSVENLKNFKELIKNWDGPSCKCSACTCLV